MEYSSTTPIAITVILVLVAALFVWLSLTMAAAEGAVRYRRQLCVLPHRLQCARRRTGVFHRIPVGCGTVD